MVTILCLELFMETTVFLFSYLEQLLCGPFYALMYPWWGVVIPVALFFFIMKFEAYYVCLWDESKWRMASWMVFVDATHLKILVSRQLKSHV